MGIDNCKDCCRTEKDYILQKKLDLTKKLIEDLDKNPTNRDSIIEDFNKINDLYDSEIERLKTLLFHFTGKME